MPQANLSRASYFTGMALSDDFDRRMLGRALELAREAVRAGSSPIGCVIVDAAGRVLSEGYNRSSLP